MPQKRTNPGRVELYRAAGAILKENRRDVIQAWVGVIASVIVINVVSFGTWFAGAATGALVTFLICMTYWSTWYASGLGHRLAGTWSEGFTNEELGKTAASLRVVPNLRFDHFDVDHAVVARHGVYAIETKHHDWLRADVLQSDARQAARAGRTLRLALTKGSCKLLPDDPALFSTVLVIWGRGAKNLEQITIDTDLGPVMVVRGLELVDWFAKQGRGSLSTAEVDAIYDYLNTTAETREAAQAPESWLLRRLARVD